MRLMALHDKEMRMPRRRQATHHLLDAQPGLSLANISNGAAIDVFSNLRRYTANLASHHRADNSNAVIK
jgi:hypothetical protein